MNLVLQPTGCVHVTMVRTRILLPAIKSALDGSIGGVVSFELH